MSHNPRPINYQFGRFVVRPSERQLTKDGQPAPLGPRAFDVLLFLLEHRGGLVEKKLLLEHAWPGVIVEDNTLQAVISTLRKLLGADAIATVSKFGYRFNLPFEAVALQNERVEPVRDATHPVFQSSFVGRRKELAVLAEILQRARNVTIHGSGGAGKTRLALETARCVASSFADGFRFLDLTSVNQGSMLTHRAAALFDLSESTSSSAHDLLIEHLRDQSMLLIVDNAEHLLSAVATMVDKLLSSCPKLVILTTSRQPNGSLGELVFPIPALSLPDTKRGDDPQQMLRSDAFCLFVDRARLQKPHFELTPEAAASIASICHRLDGIPLSIELAASRIRAMSVQEIDQRLDTALRLLVSQTSDAPRRHQTLRALIEWSYALLQAEEQQMFRRVSVFSGGFTLEMLEAVFASAGVASWTVLEVLETLIDKSMLSVERGASLIRYRQLETVRQYASEKLAEAGESGEWQALHLKYFSERVVQANAGSSYISEALRELGNEHDNIDAALRVALERDDLALLGLQTSVGLTRYWFNRGRQVSGCYWLTALLARTPANVDELLRIRAQSWVGVFLNASADFVAANVAHEQSLKLARAASNGQGALLGLNNYAGSAATQGDHHKALSIMLDAIGLLGRATDNQVASELSGLAAYSGSDYGDRLPEEEMEILGAQLASGLKTPAASLALQLRNLGMHLTRSGDYLNAERALHEAIRLAQLEGDTILVGGCQSILANLVERLGRFKDALQIFTDAFRALAPSGENKMLCTVLDGVAGALIRCGNSGEAVRFWGASERLRIETRLVMTPEDMIDREEKQALALGMLGDEERYQSLFRAGYDCDMDALLAILK